MEAPNCCRDMKILVTNDDGIYSPGLAALAEAAQNFGEVIVVAPDVEQSSMGHAVTHSRPLRYKRSPQGFKELEAYRVNGTPADCVAMGTHIWKDVDVVLSGINMGPNLGNSMWHSGTLAAAKQAVLFGIKGIAFSTIVGKTEPDFDRLAPYVERTLQMLLGDEKLALFNVNLPPDPSDIIWTRQSVRFYDGIIIPDKDPLGRQHYWFTIAPMDAAEEGTDRWAIEQGKVSITPLRLDLTNEAMLEGKLN